MKYKNSDDLMEENLDHEKLELVLDEELCTATMVTLVRLLQLDLAPRTFELGGFTFVNCNGLSLPFSPHYTTSYGHQIIVYATKCYYVLNDPNEGIIYQKLFLFG